MKIYLITVKQEIVAHQEIFLGRVIKMHEVVAPHCQKNFKKTKKIQNSSQFSFLEQKNINFLKK